MASIDLNPIMNSLGDLDSLPYEGTADFQDDFGNVISPFSESTNSNFIQSMEVSSSFESDDSSSSFQPLIGSFAEVLHAPRAPRQRHGDPTSFSYVIKSPHPPLNRPPSMNRLKDELLMLRQDIDGDQELFQTLNGNLQHSSATVCSNNNKITPQSQTSFPTSDDCICSLASRSIDDMIHDCSYSVTSSSGSIGLEQQTSTMLKNLEKELQHERERKHSIRERLERLQEHHQSSSTNPNQKPQTSRKLSFESFKIMYSPQTNKHKRNYPPREKKGLRLLLVGLAVLSLLYLQSFLSPPTPVESPHTRTQRRIRFRNKRTTQQLFQACENPGYEQPLPFIVAQAANQSILVARELHTATKDAHHSKTRSWNHRLAQHSQLHLLQDTDDDGDIHDMLVFWL